MTDIRKQQEALWAARDGIAKFAKAMESLSVDHSVRGSEELWDKGLDLWSEFTKYDMALAEQRFGISLGRRASDTEEA